MARWLSFDVEERSRFNRAQLVLDAMEVTAPRTVGALARETGLEHHDLGEALALLEDLALVELEDDEGQELSRFARRHTGGAHRRAFSGRPNPLDFHIAPSGGA